MKVLCKTTKRKKSVTTASTGQDSNQVSTEYKLTPCDMCTCSHSY